ncbi:MAG: glycosyltransferase family A protein, partial [Propionibacteriaceae bacterium]
FRRPDDIASVLPLLVEQAATVADDDLAVSILVIDNDPEESARERVGAFAAGSSVPVRYVPEHTPGISAARNRALSEAADRDLLVFIDDDERPTEAWLRSLLDTYRDYRSAAVVGPVVSEYEVEPDPWIVAGGFFTRRRLPTGTSLDVAATNNLLLDLRQIRAHDLSFDLAFGIGGGEDTLFTRTLHQRGALLVWCDEAVVIDVVPRSRLTRSWVVHRRFSSGNSWSLTSLALAGSPVRRAKVRLTSSGWGVLRLGGGAARYLLGVVRRSVGARASGMKTMARGAGMLAGAWGYSYQEYRRSSS